MNLWNGTMAQLRVVHALALRETMTQFGKHRLGYLWALFEPIFWIATFYGLYALGGRHSPDGMALMPFLTTGIITYQLFNRTAERGSAAVAANKALLFYPQVQTIDLVFARTALEAATGAVVFGVLLGGYALYEQELAIDSVLMTIWGLTLASLLGMTLGLVLCAWSVVLPTVERLKGPLMRPLFWTSGLFFTANSLPTQVREILLWNPVLHCVEIVRAGWFAEYHSQHASSSYVLLWVVGLAFVGLALERSVRRRVELT